MANSFRVRVFTDRVEIPCEPAPYGMVLHAGLAAAGYPLITDWMVSDPESGCRVCQASTRAAALETLENLVLAHGGAASFYLIVGARRAYWAECDRRHLLY